MKGEWTSQGHVPEIFDNLLSEGKIKPMIVVMPNGHPNESAVPNLIPLTERSDVSPMTRIPVALLEAHATQISSSFSEDVMLIASVLPFPWRSRWQRSRVGLGHFVAIEGGP